MNKKETIIRMSKDAGITALQAAKAFSSLLEGVKGTLRKGEKVTFSGFGSFEVKQRRARKGRNPKTGDLIKVEGKKLPFFKVGKEMRERVDL